MYLLYKQDNHQKREFGFQDFFPMEDISKSQAGLKIITTKEFLQRMGVTGKMHDLETGEISFPPMVRVQACAKLLASEQNRDSPVLTSYLALELDCLGHGHGSCRPATKPLASEGRLCALELESR